MDEPQFTLSLRDITNQLNTEGINISESAVRKYAGKNYPEFYPSFKPDGERWSLFPTVCIAITRRIFELSQNEGKKRHEIKSVIEAEFIEELAKLEIIIEGEAITHTAITTTQQYVHTGTRQHPDEFLTTHNNNLVKSAFFSLENHRRLIDIKDKEIAELLEENAQLKSDLESANLEIEQLREQLPEHKS